MKYKLMIHGIDSELFEGVKAEIHDSFKVSCRMALNDFFIVPEA